MDAIRLHLAVSLRHADAVLAFDLPDDTDPAPVFRASETSPTQWERTPRSGG
jgi:hypothetical protein